MAYGRGIRTEGGSGGKRGHSNMCHWEPTEWVKEQSRKLRRLQDRVIVRESGAKECREDENDRDYQES